MEAVDIARRAQQEGIDSELSDLEEVPNTAASGGHAQPTSAGRQPTRRARAGQTPKDALKREQRQLKAQIVSMARQRKLEATAWWTQIGPAVRDILHGLIP